MNNQEKYDIAFRMSSRSISGFFFIQDYLNKNTDTDLACLRSLYILFSFHFELILKSRITMIKSFKDQKELEKYLKKLNHNIEKIGQELGKIELENIDISSISLEEKPFKKYLVTIKNGKTITIWDFTDIRYDFFDDENKKTRLRIFKGNENSILQEDLNIAQRILEKVKEENRKDKGYVAL